MVQQFVCKISTPIFCNFYLISLHSHEIKFGFGSKQQSVTAFDRSDDSNSLWLIKEGRGTEFKPISKKN